MKCSYCNREFNKKYGMLIYEFNDKQHIYCSATCFITKHLGVIEKICNKIKNGGKNEC